MLIRPWSTEELASELAKSIAIFREQRILEPLEAYLEVFDQYRAVVEDLLEDTVDLDRLRERAPAILSNPQSADILRYLVGPPISADDLKVIAEAVLSGRRLQTEVGMVERIVQVVLDGLDRARFPWIRERRDPTEQERYAAVLATAALIATRRTETARRTAGKVEQEAAVERALLGVGLIKIPAKPVPNMLSAPRPGEICRETLLGKRKADFIVGLWNGRIMPIECKVSNSATNSVKRLNNDAAVKAEVWRDDFGSVNVVPVAVLSGVYKLLNLEEAQRRGLSLFWAHDLESLLDWIEKTKG